MRLEDGQSGNRISVIVELTAAGLTSIGPELYNRSTYQSTSGFEFGLAWSRQLRLN